MKITRSGWPEFDKSCLHELWGKAVLFDDNMKDLKYLKDHLPFFKDLTEQVLGLSPSVRVRINRSQYAFYDDLDIGPFCSFAFFKSRFCVSPKRLNPADVKDLNCDIFSFEGKKYRMGGIFSVQFFNWDNQDLAKALEVAKRSLASSERVGPAPFFGDLKKRGV
jgi:hypothetical protein